MALGKENLHSELRWRIHSLDICNECEISIKRLLPLFNRQKIVSNK